MNRFRILTAFLFAALLVSGALASCHAKTEKPMTSATEPFTSGVTKAPTDAPQSTEKPQKTTKKPQQTTKKPETTKKPQETETPEDANAPTVGLEFKLTEDGTGYAVSAGSATGKSRIVIPAEHHGKPVTEIAYNGFVRCSLKNIVIPDSITAIGSNAFEFCTELTEVTIPDSVTNPGWFTFVACRKLTSVTLPGGLTEITPRAVSGLQRAEKHYHPEHGHVHRRRRFFGLPRAEGIAHSARGYVDHERRDPILRPPADAGHSGKRDKHTGLRAPGLQESENRDLRRNGGAMEPDQKRRLQPRTWQRLLV